MFAKLDRGIFKAAPRTIAYKGMTVANPGETMLREAGYLPVVNSIPPETDKNHSCIFHWEQDGNQILQVWEITDIPSDMPTLEQRVADLETIITGEGL